MSKALEAAAKAVSDIIGPPVGTPEYLAKHADRLIERHRQTAEKFARAAISAYLSALAEDEEVVERVARGICEYDSDPLPPHTEFGTHPMGMARAAIRALVGEK